MALSAKHRAFVEAYLETWNATDAYSRVYPKSTRDAARAHGARLVANGNIAAEIKRRVDEVAMTAPEVLAILGKQARADIKEFLAVAGNGDVALDISKAEGKTHLIKKVTQRRTRRTTKDSVTEETVMTVELHDAQAAAVWIGKHHKLFTDQVEQSGEVIVRVEYGNNRNGRSTATPSETD